MREKGYGWGLLSYSVFSARLDTLNCSRGTTMTVTEGAPSLTADPPPVAPPVRLRAPGSAPSPASKRPAGRWPPPGPRARGGTARGEGASPSSRHIAERGSTLRTRGLVSRPDGPASRTPGPPEGRGLRGVPGAVDLIAPRRIASR